MNKDVPTIIIGLGGIGSEIVSKTEIQMQQWDTEKKRQGYKRKNIRFVIIDTDINSIREREESGYRGYSVRLSSNISVGNCLEQDEVAKIEWFPNNGMYYKKSIAEGAGQIRSISRLALQRAIRNGGLMPLHKAINDLFEHDSNLHEQEMKIMIVSTIAGGTGSGALLPLGMHIKDYLNRVYSGSGAKINAFLILPDILYDVIPSKKEKRNLNANSYAVVKEIDALMNADQNGAPNHTYVTLPNESDEEITRFSDCPFDFCFLFNKLSRQKMVYGNIEDYKDVIARCLRTQFLGTLSSEYFSKEDNVLSSSVRGTQNEKHNERFAGSGCSIIRYPFAEIREYLSLCWLLDIMKQEWVKYDEGRREIRKINQEKQERGEEMCVYSNGEAYLCAVAERDRKEKEVKNALLSCEEKLNLRCQGAAQGGLWENLKKYISERVKQEYSDVQLQMEDGYNIITKIKKIKDQREHLNDYLAMKMEIEKEKERIYMSLSGVLEREVCRLHKGDIKPYHLEYYIKNNEDEFDTPNYIRFYLYKLEKELENAKENLENEIETDKDVYDSSFEVEMYSPVNKLKKNGIKRVVKERYELYKLLYELLIKELENHCISQLIRYIQNISANYEKFFREYNRMLLLTEQRKTELEKHFSTEIHRMEHWVYSEKEYLQRMICQMKMKPEYYTVGGQISEWLYMENVKQDRDSLEESLAEQYEKVKTMWENQFDKTYARMFDIDILKALEEEAKAKNGGIIDYQHVQRRLHQARDNASILLSSCRYPDVKTRKYCIYPPKILEEIDCDEIVKEFFKNGMALPDSRGLDVDEKQIVFFEIAYGFLPGDIDFFADTSGVCADYSMGSGAQSYRWVIEHFCPNKKDAKITPHIDKRWHKKEFLHVNWEMPIFSLRFMLILCILYVRTLKDSEKMGDALEQKLSESVERELELCFGMSEQEIWKRWNDVLKDSETSLEARWSQDVEDEIIKETIKKIRYINKVLGEKWCQSQKGSENLMREMENIFWMLLENAKWISDETLRKCKEEWVKF